MQDTSNIRLLIVIAGLVFIFMILPFILLSKGGKKNDADESNKTSETGGEEKKPK